MSNGGSLMDGIRGIFSGSGSSGGSRADAAGGDPVAERLERVEQIASGVSMAAAALPDERKELRREAEAAAEATLEAARARAPRTEDASGGEEGADPTGPDRDALRAISRCVEVLEELHYRLLRIEVHPEVDSGEERERAAESAREAVEEAREVAESLSGAQAA